MAAVDPNPAPTYDQAEQAAETDTLGPCGCVDYHRADCPLRTAQRDYYSEMEDREYDDYYDYP